MYVRRRSVSSVREKLHNKQTNQVRFISHIKFWGKKSGKYARLRNCAEIMSKNWGGKRKCAACVCAAPGIHIIYPGMHHVTTEGSQTQLKVTHGIHVAAKLPRNVLVDTAARGTHYDNYSDGQKSTGLSVLAARTTSSRRVCRDWNDRESHCH